MRNVVFWVLLIGWGEVVFAEARERLVDLRPTEVISVTEEKSAMEWGLTTEQWQRYQHIMAGPRGRWSPDLDPVTVLGIDATSITEQEHYATLYIEQQHARVVKEQRFQLTLNRIRQDYYKNIPVSRAIENPEANSYALFISAQDCGDRCQQWLQRGMGFVNARGSTLHIYLKDVTTDQQVRDWTVRWSIPVRMMYDQHVVLHPDTEGRYYDKISESLSGARFPMLVAMTTNGPQKVLL